MVPPEIRSAESTTLRARSVNPASPSSPIPTITSFDRASLNVRFPPLRETASTRGPARESTRRPSPYHSPNGQRERCRDRTGAMRSSIVLPRRRTIQSNPFRAETQALKAHSARLNTR